MWTAVFLCPTQRRTRPGVELLRRNGVPCVLVGPLVFRTAVSPDCVVFDDLERRVPGRQGNILAFARPPANEVLLSRRAGVRLQRPRAASAGCLAALRDANVRVRRGADAGGGRSPQTLPRASSRRSRRRRRARRRRVRLFQITSPGRRLMRLLRARACACRRTSAVVGFDDIQCEDARAGAADDHRLRQARRRRMSTMKMWSGIHVQHMWSSAGTTCPRA